MSIRKVRARSRERGRTKPRKTFTLSPESVALLEELSAQRNSRRGQESVSAVLDDLLIALRREKTQETEERIGKYYDERSEELREEEIAWGEFAMAEFAADEMNKARR